MAYLTRAQKSAWRALRAYAAPNLVNLSCLLNSALFGPAKQTLTQRAQAARLAGRRWGCVLCKLLHRLDKNHCDKYGLPD